MLGELGADGTVRGGLPVVDVSSRLRGRRWVSLPFADHCGPLGSFGGELAEVLTAARLHAGVGSLEVRADVPGGTVHRVPEGVRHVLQLGDDPEAQFSAFHRMTRRNVRQAERSGVEVRLGDDPTSITQDFYALQVETRRRLGVPVQPRRFFHLVWEELVSRDLGFVLLAYLDGKPVAGAVFLIWNGNVVYKFGASAQDAWQARPNNLVFWDAIQRAIDLGARSLDFGRSELEQEGLRSFKSGWGAVEEPLVYSYIAERAPRTEMRARSAYLAPLVRRSPAWVTRLLGELLYRYAA